MKSLELTRNEGELLVDILEQHKDFKTNKMIEAISSEVRKIFGMTTIRHQKGLEKICGFTPYRSPKWTSQHEEAVKKMISDYSMRVELLTEKQLAELILQLIASGDIIRNIMPPHHSYDFGQSVDYVPFRRVEGLEGRIKELEQQLELLKNELPQ